MQHGPRFLLLFPLAALLACGSSATLLPSTSSSLNLTGNWMVLGTPYSSTPTTLPSPIADFTGALQSSNGTITGTLRAFDGSTNPCVPLTQDLAVTGSDSSATSLSGTVNNLSLTVPIANGTATITADLPQNLNSYITGSYQIVGGACTMPATPMIISQFASATGTYTGTLNVVNQTTYLPIPGTATAITAVLTQSAIPNADGQFPLTGTVSANGACNANLAFSNGIVFGNGILSQPLTGPSNPQGFFGGAIDPTATTFTGLFEAFSNCNNQEYQGTLTRQ